MLVWSFWSQSSHNLTCNIFSNQSALVKRFRLSSFRGKVWCSFLNKCFHSLMTILLQKLNKTQTNCMSDDRNLPLLWCTHSHTQHSHWFNDCLLCESKLSSYSLEKQAQNSRVTRYARGITRCTSSLLTPVTDS